MNITLPVSITKADLQAYREDGAVCLRGILDAEWCERMLDASVRIMDRPDDQTRDTREAGGGRFYRNLWMARREPDFAALRDRSPMAELAARLMQAPKVRYFYDQLFIKEPGTQMPTQWHQDLPFWPYQGEDIVSLWIALTPVTKATSGVGYVAGSHRWNKFYKAVTPDANPARMDPTAELCPDYSNPPEGVRMLCWDMEPGDVLCHHPLTIHGAGGNTSSTRRRVGLSIRFFGRDARYDPRPHAMRLDLTPRVQPGEYPADDEVYPVIWEQGRGLVNTVAVKMSSEERL